MKFIMKVRMAGGDEGNRILKDPQFGKKMQEALADLKPDAVYFTTLCGHRGFYAIINMEETSQMAAIAEPFFLWLGAEIDWYPVMRPEDLAKAGPAIQAANKKWG